MTEGRKYDDTKGDMPALIAPEFTEGIGKVLCYGAKKYAPGNWAKGMKYSRVMNALERHYIAWKKGEKHDPETGLSHLYHMACNLMFLVAYDERGTGVDDRYEAGILAASALGHSKGDSPPNTPSPYTDSVGVIPGLYYPSAPGALAHNHPNVVWPYDDSSNHRTRYVGPVRSPLPGNVKGPVVDT